MSCSIGLGAPLCKLFLHENSYCTAGGSPSNLPLLAQVLATCPAVIGVESICWCPASHGLNLIRCYRKIQCFMKQQVLYVSYYTCQRRDKLERRVALLQHALSSEALSLFPDFQQRLGVLRRYDAPVGVLERWICHDLVPYKLV